MAERRATLDRLLPAAFFVSGMSGLMFEVVWTRSLVLVFGATSLAVASVLSAYMAGLGLGSFAGGRLAERVRRPVLAYGLLEGGVALFGLLMPWLIGALATIYRPLYLRYAPHFLSFSLLRFGLVFAALLLPTTLMGATLPLLSHHLASGHDGTGVHRSVGGLYAANTAGAVLGTLLSGFWLLPAVGLAATNAVACALGLVLCAAVAWLGARLVPERRAPLDVARGTSSRTPPAAYVVLAGFAVAGGASMIDEVAWTRALVQVVGPSTYAFSVMLAVFLAGIALGSAYATGRLHRIARPRLTFALVEAAAAAATLLGVLGFEPVEILYRAFTHAAPGGRGSLSLGMKTVAVGALLGPTTLLLGAAFPLATAAWVQRDQRVGRRVGLLYGSNTLGCIGGSVAAGFFLVPRWGIAESLQGAAALNALVAAALFAVGEGVSTRVRASGAALLVLVSVALSRAGVHWDELLLTSGSNASTSQLLYERPGYGATITVTAQGTRWTSRALHTDGKVDGSDMFDLNTQVQLGLVPMLLHDHPERVLEVGLATGTTCGSILKDPRVKSLDVLEIEEAMVDASHFFDSMNGRPLEDPRTRLIEIDARNYYRASDRSYDVIVSEPSNPWMSGPSHLFTREAFQEAHDRLAPGGIMLQWLQGYEMSGDTGRAIAAAFRAVFPHMRVFLVHDMLDLLLVGSDSPLALDMDAIAKRLEPLRPELHRASIDDPWDLAAESLADEASVARATQGVAPNTDDNGAVEFGAPRDLDAPAGVREALSTGYPGPYAELESQGIAPEVIGGRLGWRILENYDFILAGRLTQYLTDRGQADLARELDASWKVRPELPAIEGPWQKLLRRQRLWQLELPQPSAVLTLPLPPTAPEARWLAALQGLSSGPIADIDFASPLGALEVLAAARRSECPTVLQARVPFQMLYEAGSMEWGQLRAASAAGDMARALAICGDPSTAAVLAADDADHRREMAGLLEEYVPGVPHFQPLVPATITGLPSR